MEAKYRYLGVLMCLNIRIELFMSALSYVSFFLLQEWASICFPVLFVVSFFEILVTH